MSIYEQTVSSIPASDIDHHESDLYVRVTIASKAIISAYEFKNNVTIFTGNIDKDLWFDIPFEYDPFWNERSIS